MNVISNIIMSISVCMNNDSIYTLSPNFCMPCLFSMYLQLKYQNIEMQVIIGNAIMLIINISFDVEKKNVYALLVTTLVLFSAYFLTRRIIWTF